MDNESKLWLKRKTALEDVDNNIPKMEQMNEVDGLGSKCSDFFLGQKYIALGAVH